MAITADGSENSLSYSAVSSSGALTVAVGGSAQANALMLAAIAFTVTNTTPASVSSITDSQGNTWARYTEQHAGSAWDTTQTVNGAQKGFTLEVWYTKAATINASIDVTINHSGTIDAAVACFSPKFLGYDATNPFDANASLPKALRVNASAAETLTGISTTTTNVYPVWALGLWGTNLNVSNVTFDSVTRTFQTSLQKNASEFVKAQFAAGPAATGPYSSVSFASPTSGSNFYAIGLALTADVGPPVPPTIARAQIIG